MLNNENITHLSLSVNSSGDKKHGDRIEVVGRAAESFSVEGMRNLQRLAAANHYPAKKRSWVSTRAGWTPSRTQAPA